MYLVTYVYYVSLCDVRINIATFLLRTKSMCVMSTMNYCIYQLQYIANYTLYFLSAGLDNNRACNAFSTSIAIVYAV